MRMRNVRSVDSWRLCVGCGACTYICHERSISLENLPEEGIRPRIDGSRCRECGDCLKVCPGLEITHSHDDRYGFIPELSKSWGPILEVWEGYAADPDIRFSGSSGGLVSAFAQYCVEEGGMLGALHVGQGGDNPLENRTVFSTSPSHILARTGSRYSPASPCDGLDLIESANDKCVFIGKPCDVAGLRKAMQLRPGLARNVGAAIGIFCAGTPSERGTVDLLRKYDIDISSVTEIRYRGLGWPGKFSVRMKGEDGFRELTTYMDAWDFIQKYRPYRCYLCPDATSEFADISCGDPWYRRIEKGDNGHSLVLVRTELGKKILRGAMEAGYVILERTDPSVLAASQPGMPAKRGAIWGRIVTMKALGIPTPKLAGFSLFKNWWCLSKLEKVRSIIGTARRIIVRKYYLPKVRLR